MQRQIVLDALNNLASHPTAEEVYLYVAQAHPSISKATVYRNLNQMAESGDLLNIGSFYGSSHYDHNCHDHYHFICDECRRVFDIDNSFPDVTKLTKMEGFEIKGHNLSFYGICDECK